MAKSKQDYQKLKHSAYEIVVVQGQTQKYASELLGVPEKTVSDWATGGQWRELRMARQSTLSNTNENIRKIISLLAERKLTLEQQINDAVAAGDKDTELSLRKEARALSDDIAKQNKTLQNNDKSAGITLGLYIDVMDDVFNNMRTYSEDLYDKTLEFQAYLIRKKTIELG